MKVLKVSCSHKNSNSKKKQSQFSIIFILASQYRSHSVLLSSAVHCPRWFLSMSENGLVSNIGKQSKMKIYTNMRRLTTGIRSEKCVIRWFCRCANVYLLKPRQYSIAYYTPRLYGIAQRFPTCAPRSPKGYACNSQGLRGGSRKIK
jgi:hypothetical protein